MNKISLVLVIILSFTFGCKAQTQSERIAIYNTEIIGAWIDEDDSNYRLEFLTNGTCKEYEGTELLTTYNYSIEGNSCGDFSTPNVIYLKWVDTEDMQTTCLELLNITDVSLSLMIIERAKRLFFNKQ